eukprot:21216-Chlamydomonas_euryale.AAC.1
MRGVAKAALSPAVLAALAFVPDGVRGLWQPAGALPAIEALEDEERTARGSDDGAVKAAAAAALPAAAAAGASSKADGGSTGGRRPVLCRPDGYPWDADAVRRYLMYATMAGTAICYHHLTEFEVAEVAAALPS